MPTSSMKSAILHLREVVLRKAQELTDCQLLDSFVAECDEAAFEMIVRRHGPMVLGVCRRIVGSVHDAEDAFQAVFLVLARKAASISRKELLANWLYGVAQRTSLAAKGKMARQRSHEKQVKDMSQSVAKPPAPRDDWLSLLDAEVSKLPDKYRIPIVLCDLQGRTRQEAARQLKIPEGTLSSRLATARKLLAHRLGRHGPVLSGGALAVTLAQNAASAAVPTTIISVTVAAAASVAAGKVLPAGVVSAEVTALAEGVLKAMFLSKLLRTAAVVMALLVMLGVGTLTSGMLASGQTNGEAPAKQAATQEKPEKTPQDKNPTAPKGEQIDDNKTLQGEWRVVKFEQGGAEQTEKLKDELKDVRITITEDAILIRDNFSPEGKKSTFKLASNHSPKWIDVTPDFGEFKGQQLAGIYALEKGRLRICIIDRADRQRDVKNRPKEFKTEAGDGLGLLTLERVKPKNADPKKDKGEEANAKPKGDAGRPIRSLPGHTDRLTSVAYSPDGKSIATASWDGTARIWDAKTGQEVRLVEFPATKGYNTFGQIVFSPDNAFIVTSVRESTDGAAVIVWDRRTREKVRTFPSEAGSVAVSPDGSLIACGGYRVIRLYEFATGKLVREMHGDEKQLRIESLTFAPDGKTLVSTGHPPTPQRGDGVQRLTIMPDVIRVWDVATGKERPSALNGLVVGRLGQRIALSPDGRTLVHDISLRETATGGLRAKLTGHKNEVCDYAFFPDGRTMASGSMDGTVRLWDLPSGKEVGRFGKEVEPFKGGWVLALAFAPDGRSLVSGGLNKTADIWDVSRITGRPRISAERSPAELEGDWKDLGGDAAKGYAALGRLVSSPGRGVAFLGKQLQSTEPVDTKRIERLIADLDKDGFQVREQARKELEALGECAVPLLKNALAGSPALEARRRLEALLDRLEAAGLSVATVRQIRAVETLESIGNPEALRLLEKLAAGPPEMRLTQEALASARRLAKRSP